MAALSSDEDELGGSYNSAETPFRVEKFTNTTLKVTKPNGRAAVAGPSSKSINGNGNARRDARKRLPSPAVDDAEEKHAHASDEGGAEVLALRKMRPKRAASREPEPVALPRSRNATRGNWKGKGKVMPGSARETSPEGMDFGNLDREEIEGYPQEFPQVNVQPRRPNEKQTSGDNLGRKQQQERDRSSLERMQKQVQDLKTQRDSLAAQLEEAFHTRNTELEERLQTQASVYDSRIQTQEELIQELTFQLARIDSLTREGKTSTLHFLTREAADEERRDVERQVEQLKEALREKDIEIAVRDTSIQERDVEIRTLKVELNAEVERSKTLAAASRSNARGPTSRGHAFSGSTGVRLEGVKSSNILRLYEDMSNILIIDCKCEISNDSNDEHWVYTCLYTMSGQSLSFSIRTYMELGENGEDVEKVAYSPLHMSDNSPESMEKLDFLAEEFTFHRKQLDVFLDKLYTAMNDAFGATENE